MGGHSSSGNASLDADLGARLIVVSASRRREQGIHQLGAQATIGKPFDLSEVLRQVATLASSNGSAYTSLS
jgi:hypothetical protein